VLCGSLLVCIAVVSLPPAAWGLGIQALVRRNFEGAESIRLRLAGHDLGPEGRLNLEVKFDGVPEAIRPELDLFRLELAAGETTWDSGWRTGYGAPQSHQSIMLSATIAPAFLQKVQSRDVELRLLAALTLLGSELTQVVDMRHGDVPVQDFGICGLREQASDGRGMYCRTGAPPPARVTVPLPYVDFPMTLDWPIRFSLAASPVWRTTVRLPAYLNGQVAFTLRKPVAHLRRQLVIEKIRLTSAP
jgi:hypothetical protein